MGNAGDTTAQCRSFKPESRDREPEMGMCHRCIPPRRAAELQAGAFLDAESASCDEPGEAMSAQGSNSHPNLPIPPQIIPTASKTPLPGLTWASRMNLPSARQSLVQLNPLLFPAVFSPKAPHGQRHPEGFPLGQPGVAMESKSHEEPLMG